MIDAEFINWALKVLTISGLVGGVAYVLIHLAIRHLKRNEGRDSGGD